MEDVIVKLQALDVDLHNASAIVIVSRIVTANPRYYKDEDYKSEVLSKAKERYHNLLEETKKARAEKAKECYGKDEDYRNKIREISKEWFRVRRAKAAESKATTVNLQISESLGSCFFTTLFGMTLIFLPSLSSVA